MYTRTSAVVGKNVEENKINIVGKVIKTLYTYTDILHSVSKSIFHKKKKKENNNLYIYIYVYAKTYMKCVHLGNLDARQVLLFSRQSPT